MLPSCGWGASYFDLDGVDVAAIEVAAVDLGVGAVLDRGDFFGEPRADVGRDCRSEHAEACVLWIGSAFSRARFFISNDDPGEVTPLVIHELQHAALWDRPNACASHSPDCGWVDP